MNATLARFLWIEDNPGDIELMRYVLRETGCGTAFDTVSNGGDALDLLRELAVSEPEDHPRLILLDLNLPRVHGHEILAFLKESPALQHIPTVVLTTSDAPRDRERCVALGCTEFFVKPPSLQGYLDLARRLETYLAEPPAA